jgi:signal transduction histidine kinase
MANLFPSCWRSLSCLLLLASSISAGAAEEPWLVTVARLLSPKYRQLEERERVLHLESASLPSPPVSQQSERIGWHSTFSSNPNATKWLQVDLGRVQPFDSVTLIPVDVAYGTHAGPGFGFPVRFRVEASDEAAFSEPRLLAAFDGEDFPNPGNSPVFLETPEAAGRYVRVTATRLWPRGDLALLALGEVVILHGEADLAAGAPVAASDAYNNPPTWQPSNATDGQTVLGAPIEVMTTPGNGWHATTAREPDTTKWVQVDLGREVPLDEVRLYPARPKDFPARRGFGFPPRFRVEVSDDAVFTHPRMLMDRTQADFENPAENAVIVPAAGIQARFVRVTATRLWARSNDFIFALAELEIWSGGENVARSGVVTSLDTIEAASWSSRFLNDGFNSQGRIVPLPEWLRGLSRRREMEFELGRIATAERQAVEAIARASAGSGIGVTVFIAAVLMMWLRHRARGRRREVEQLRQRIAGDLHDEIGSNLGSIALLSQMALHDPGEAQGDLAEINRVARETADSMRDLVWFIKPSKLEAGDFVAKLRETAATMLAGLEWTFEGTVSAEAWPLEFKRQVFLIFKEALHNVRRHASASRVQIRFAEESGVIEMAVEDNGRGFATNGSSSGHGLVSMRQRAETLGGSLVLDSGIGSGTRVTLKVKVTSQGRAANT